MTSDRPIELDGPKLQLAPASALLAGPLFLGLPQMPLNALGILSEIAKVARQLERLAGHLLHTAAMVLSRLTASDPVEDLENLPSRRE